MYFFKKVVLILILHGITGAYEVNSPPYMTLSWSQEVNEDYREYDNIKSPIYSVLVGKSNHSFALLRCLTVEDAYSRNCSLTVQTHTFDGRVYSSDCEIQPPPEHDASAILQDSMTFLRNNRVLVSWKEEHLVHGWRMASQVIFTDTCQTSDFIHVHTLMDEEFAIHTVLRFNNSFDIIFGNDESCPGGDYCKLSYDHNGAPQRTVPTSISSLLLSRNDKFTFGKAYPVSYTSGEGIVLIGQNQGFPFGLKNIYSPVIGWIEAKNMSWIENIYSNSSGFATLCWRPDRVPNQLSCKWLDETHGNTTLTFDFKPFFSKLPLIYNTPKGNIMLINRGSDERGMLNLFVDEVITNTQCKRLAQVLFPAYADLVAFSMSNQNQFCYSYLFKDWESFGNPSTMHYALSTECIQIPNYTLFKYRRCGH